MISMPFHNQGKSQGVSSGMVVAIVNDTHCGSTIGLMPEKFETNDGQTVIPSKTQAYMWEKWVEGWDWTVEFAGKRDLVVVTNGDLTENLHHKTTQVWSARADEHERCAVECFTPWLDHFADVLVVKGTPAHVGQGGQMEERISRTLNSIPTEQATTTYHRLRKSFSGVRLDITHHRGGNTVPWTKGNAMRKVVLSALINYPEAGLPVPHLILRAHRHLWEDTYDKYSRRCRGVALPGWQGKTEYVHQYLPDDRILSDLGMLVVECDAGEYAVHKLKFDWPEELKPGFEEWQSQ